MKVERKKKKPPARNPTCRMRANDTKLKVRSDTGYRKQETGERKTGRMEYFTSWWIFAFSAVSLPSFLREGQVVNPLPIDRQATEVSGGWVKIMITQLQRMKPKKLLNFDFIIPCSEIRLKEMNIEQGTQIFELKSPSSSLGNLLSNHEKHWWTQITLFGLILNLMVK